MLALGILDGLLTGVVLLFAGVLFAVFAAVDLVWSILTRKWLHLGALLRSPRLIKRGLARGLSPLDESLTGSTPLHLAGHIPSLGLQEATLSEDRTSEERVAALKLASSTPRLLPLACKLVESGVRPPEELGGWRVLDDLATAIAKLSVRDGWESKQANSELVLALIQSNDSLRAGHGMRPTTAAELVQRLSPEAVLALVEAGLPLEGAVLHGNVLEAVRYGTKDAPELVRRLIELGASTEPKYSSREPALVSAIEQDDIESVRALLDGGVETQRDAGMLRYPLDIAIEKRGPTHAITELLRSRGAQTFNEYQESKKAAEAAAAKDQERRNREAAEERERKERESRERAQREQRERARQGQRQQAAPATVPQRLKDLGMLGLDESATHGDIRSAYKRLAKVHHPDQFNSSGEGAVKAASETFTRIQAAYERLTKD